MWLLASMTMILHPKIKGKTNKKEEVVVQAQCKKGENLTISNQKGAW